MHTKHFLAVFVCLFGAVSGLAQQYKYPFQNPDLPIEQRVNNILLLMTVDEKIAALSTDPSVPRLGIQGSSHIEGLHGVALGGPGGWGGRGLQPLPTTQFPQSVGLGETWDPELLRQVAAIEGYEARYTFNTDTQFTVNQRGDKHRRVGIVIRAPNADLARDPRWGRSEESFGEDPYLTGTMTAAFAKGLQGDDSRYWLSASLMKHFLANSNENGRDETSSDFDDRLLREYYSVPFRMGVLVGGSRAYMASYNARNGIPMTVNPMLKDITMREWGQDGIICTDAGALTNLVTRHKYFPDVDEASAGAIHAGINQFLDRYREGVMGALDKKLVNLAEIDDNLRGVYRVMIRLGLLDPADMVPYNKIKGDAPVWDNPEHKALARKATLESIVLLKNADHFLPLDRTKLKSVAIIGPYADIVALDWYSGTPGYAVSAVDGLKHKLGSSVNVKFARDNTDDGARKIARDADVAIVVVGNHPTCNAGWAKCPLPSDGKEAIDRQSITLEQEELVKQVYAVNPRTVVVLIAEFSVRDSVDARACPRHSTYGAQQSGGRERLSGRTIWRLQPRRAAGDDVAHVSGPVASHDGLRHTPRAHLPVLQSEATLSVRIWAELHVVPILKFENKRKPTRTKWRDHGQSGRTQQRFTGWRRSCADVCCSRRIEGPTADPGAERLSASQPGAREESNGKASFEGRGSCLLERGERRLGNRARPNQDHDRQLLR